MEQAGAKSDREQLAEVKRQLNRLHHDLQNPLSVLSGNVELVRAVSGDFELDETIVQSLEDIHAASHQLVELLDRLKLIQSALEV